MTRFTRERIPHDGNWEDSLSKRHSSKQQGGASSALNKSLKSNILEEKIQVLV